MGSVFGEKPKKPDQSALKAQQQKEELRLAESEDEIARRKALAGGKSKGRSLLVGTSSTGTAAGAGAPAKTLGG